MENAKAKTLGAVTIVLNSFFFLLQHKLTPESADLKKNYIVKNKNILLKSQYIILGINR